MSDHKIDEEYITKAYCDLCNNSTKELIIARHELLTEKIKGIKSMFVVGFTLTTLILSAVDILLKFWR